MAKRLTKEQKQIILDSFVSGKTIEELSKSFNCTKLTISRNLKKNLGEKKYREIIIHHKIKKNTNLIGSTEDDKSELYLDSPSKNIFDNDALVSVVNVPKISF